MRRVYSGRFPSIPVYQRISPFSPGKSTINVVRASAVNLRRTTPATDSEPVSLGSNPSSPVLISRFSLTRRGAFGTRVRAFRGSTAPWGLCPAWFRDPISRLSLTRRRAFGTRVPAFRGSVVGPLARALPAFEAFPLLWGNSVPAWFRGRIAFYLSFISHAPRGFRHSGAGLTRCSCGVLRTAQSLGDSRPSLNASGGASRGARKTTSAPLSSRA